MSVYCRYCGSTELEYLGVVDGAGDYGDELADTYRCHQCDMELEVTGDYRQAFDTDYADSPEVDSADTPPVATPPTADDTGSTVSDIPF